MREGGTDRDRLSETDMHGQTDIGRLNEREREERQTGRPERD